MNIEQTRAARDAKFGEKLKNLPALVGSEKQVAWATQIREKQLEHVTRVLTSNEIAEREDAAAGDLIPELVSEWRLRAEQCERLFTETSAKFWIDSREVDLTRV